MKKLVFNRTECVDRPHEAQEIVDRLAAMGYEISLRDAHDAWEANSEAMAAGWLTLPESDEDLLREIMGFCTEAEG